MLNPKGVPHQDLVSTEHGHRPKGGSHLGIQGVERGGAESDRMDPGVQPLGEEGLSQKEGEDERRRGLQHSFIVFSWTHFASQTTDDERRGTLT